MLEKSNIMNIDKSYIQKIGKITKLQKRDDTLYPHTMTTLSSIVHP